MFKSHRMRGKSRLLARQLDQKGKFCRTQGNHGQRTLALFYFPKAHSFGKCYSNELWLGIWHALNGLLIRLYQIPTKPFRQTSVVIIIIPREAKPVAREAKAGFASRLPTWIIHCLPKTQETSEKRPVGGWGPPAGLPPPPPSPWLQCRRSYWREHSFSSKLALSLKII